MKKLALFLATILLCFSLVSALEISAKYSTDVVIKDMDNSIEMTLKITNASGGTYNIYTLSDMLIQPSETFEIETTPFEKNFLITPNDNLDVDGYYSFTYTLNHREVEKFEEKMLVNLLNLEDSIEISSNSIDPASGEVSFYIKNLESTNLKNLSAKFSSILFETEEMFDLGPNEELEISVDVDEDKLKKTKAGVYIIESEFQTKKGTKRIDGNLYLGEKKSITLAEDKSGILIQTEIVTKVNSGNILENIEIEIQRNIVSRLFTTFNIEPTITERDGFGVKYTWIKERLNPADAYTVKAKTNYIFPFLLIIFAALAIMGLKRYTETKIEIKKAVSPVKTKNGEFALRVTLGLKAKKSIENVTLIDKVPAIVKIYKKFGMVKPDKIDAENRRIHWNIGDLSAGEERMFTYIVYSKVGIVGKFSLPEALAVFEKGDQIHKVNSNKVFFMNEQIKGN